MSLWTPSLICLLIVINALYVAAEFAIVSVRVTRVEHFAAKGRRTAELLLPIVRDSASLDRYIAACQIGITLSSLVLGAFGQATVGLAFADLLIEAGGMEPVGAHALSASFTLIFLTSTQVVFGELVPKTVALQYPVDTAIYTYYPIRWSLAAYSPFIRLLNGSGSLVLRLFGAAPVADHRHVHAPDEIDLLIRESREIGLLEDKDSTRLREALKLSRHTVRQLMVPRRQITSLDLDAPQEQLLEEIAASPFTRLLVHQGGLDNVRGFLHVKDVAVAVASGHLPLAIESLVRPLLALPGGLTMDRALGQLRERRARIALVVSEFGDVQGLISLEDVIRELLGELSDEFKSSSDLVAVELPDGRWRLPGRLPLDEAIEWARSLGTPPWEPTKAGTLAGWVLEELGAIPEAGYRFSAAGLDFEIEQMDGPAIKSILATPSATQAGESDD